MSYGIWRKRGQGWSSIEIDGAGRDARRQWAEYARNYGESIAESKKRGYCKQRLKCSPALDSDYLHDDFYYLQWASNQKKKGWTLYEMESRGDHTMWIAVAPNGSIQEAMKALNLPEDTVADVFSQGRNDANYNLY